MSAPILSFVASPSPTVADGQAGIGLSLSARDGDGKGASGEAVRITGLLAGDTLSAQTDVLDADGRYQATLTSTLAGLRQLGAEVAGATASR